MIYNIILHTQTQLTEVLDVFLMKAIFSSNASKSSKLSYFVQYQMKRCFHLK